MIEHQKCLDHRPMIAVLLTEGRRGYGRKQMMAKGIHIVSGYVSCCIESIRVGLIGSSCEENCFVNFEVACDDSFRNFIDRVLVANGWPTKLQCGKKSLKLVKPNISCGSMNGRISILDSFVPKRKSLRQALIVQMWKESRPTQYRHYGWIKRLWRVGYLTWITRSGNWLWQSTSVGKSTR